MAPLPPMLPLLKKGRRGRVSITQLSRAFLASSFSFFSLSICFSLRRESDNLYTSSLVSDGTSSHTTVWFNRGLAVMGLTISTSLNLALGMSSFFSASALEEEVLFLSPAPLSPSAGG